MARTSFVSEAQTQVCALICENLCHLWLKNIVALRRRRGAKLLRRKIMKKITVSIPTDLFNELGSLASSQNTSTNELIVSLLMQTMPSDNGDPIDRLIQHSKSFSIDTSSVEWKRLDRYDRSVFHNPEES